MSLISKDMFYTFGGLDIMLLSNNNIEVKGNHSDVSGFGSTRGLTLKDNTQFITIKLKLKSSDSAWGRKIFKLEINNTTIKSIKDQQDLHDPSYVQFINSDMTYVFPLPDWLKNSKEIEKFQIVLSAFKNCNIIFTKIEAMA